MRDLFDDDNNDSNSSADFAKMFEEGKLVAAKGKAEASAAS